jgi:large conductance mechanosensitive channel
MLPFCPLKPADFWRAEQAFGRNPRPSRVNLSGSFQAAEGTMLEEFKKFAMRGNVVDLAVGVIIGAAFGTIVSSLVADIIMPIVGAVTGGLDFSSYYTQLTGAKAPPGTSLAEARKSGAVLAWGNFLTIVINFVIIAWVLFLAVRGINRLQRSEAEKPAKPAEAPRQEVLLQEIRDILARKPA